MVNHLALAHQLKQKKILLVAHRGTAGGNIIQNTIGAYENALLHQADIIEVDITRSVDGEFFAFHIGQEKGLFGQDIDITTFTASQVRKLRFLNGIQERVTEGVNSLDDVLEHFRGRCFINIDSCWLYWNEIITYLKKHCMDNQIILKSQPREEELHLLEELAPQMMYIPVVSKPEQLELVDSYHLNIVGAELIFETDEHIFASEKFIEIMHKSGKLLWVNALTLNDTIILSGGHDDDTAIRSSMEYGWGWLLDKKYDIIQTDWPLLLRTYIDERM
jgi:glycerophosphoryl diester phosphodiesterase